ncbi:ABC transporter substrate-binding protein [Paenibacillus agricola]|uniref:Iron-siderophore ABC transporter substrate-binding protein n=1 Tax=Paenibacillus agricola TaxID=2716264 RepID=A0ABX0JFC5_9BACL|nr:iron-siderophore ABC transporter substrate-binding protein [Paenibacillus agricola]NHN32919.1 iron-siderophore ABC transporter substrate-binding protein [Paenibacillus agricola]
MKKIHLLVVLAILLITAGCGTAGSNPGSASAPASTAPATPATPAKEGTTPTAAPAAFNKTITHTMGTVTLTKVPERVVVLFNGMVDITAALKVKPVGAVQSWDELPWYKFLRADMEGVKNLGDEDQPNIEAILALKPDLIIAAKGRHEKLYPQLNSIAPTIMVADLFTWKENLKVAGEALNKQDEVTKIMKEWDTRVATFKQKMGDRLGKSEVSIIRFQKDNSSRIYVTGFAGTIFQELGLPRPKAQQAEGKSVLNLTSKEQIPQMDGDYIFDITQLNDGTNSLKNSEEWLSHPLWKDLKGVKAGKYFKADPITWNLSGGSIAAKMLLDDLYKYFDIQP